jgi:hypothetical protein
LDWLYIGYKNKIEGKGYETRVVSQCGLAIYIKKYLKTTKELWNLKYFTMQKYVLQKLLSKKLNSFKIL